MTNRLGNESISAPLPGDSSIPANIQSDVVDENTEVETNVLNVRAFSS